ncbi:MAG: phosphoribosyltransferase [Dehalococcoidia bacterium]|nr:MAG: phosphoribosyltransferase [Dehalococcoidia bacterium]
MSQIRILSRSMEIFRDREEAGRLLAAALAAYRDKNPVVLGIPRGGVVVARQVARALGAELDIVLAHKLRTPGHAELAMGSVSEDGRLFLNREVVSEMGISETFIQQEKAAQMAEMNRRTAIIRRVRPKIPAEGRVAIVTDDGVATGATTHAALWAVKLEKPEKLVAAIPVGPDSTIRRLAKDVDEMVCLRAPPSFSAVGQFYLQFYPVEDEEMLEILEEEGK